MPRRRSAAPSVAVVVLKYSTDKRLADAEEAARKAGKGLWEDKTPQLPSDYRKKQREKSTP